MERILHSNIKKTVPVSRKRAFVYVPGLVLFSACILYACNNKGSDFFGSPTSAEMTDPDPDPDNQVGLEAPVLLSPPNGVLDLEPDITFEWNSVDGADAYNFEMTEADKNFEDEGGYSQNGILENKFVVDGLGFNLDYKWRVNAENENETSPFSETWTFTVMEEPVAEDPDNIEEGLFTLPANIKQVFGIIDFGSGFAGLAAKRAIAFTGETDDQPGSFILFNPFLQELLRQWFLQNFVWGTAAAFINPQQAEAVSFVMAYGPWGLATYNSQSPFPDNPDDIRTDFRVDDAVHAGGVGPTDTIVFGSGDLGVGFIKFDQGLGRFTISDEILPKSDFFGDRIWAYVDDSEAPAVVLARSQNSRLYFHKRDDGGPDLITTGLKIASSMRCLPPLCLVFSNDLAVPVFLFDGQNPPVRVADAELEFNPSRGSLMHTESGGIAALIVGRATSGNNRDRVAEVEFDADGSVIQVVPVEIPNGCTGTNGVAYVPDKSGVVAIVTCTSTNKYFVARSALFSASQ